MKALILAAGYATRFYPYTKNFPKALLRVEGRTLLDHILDKITEVPGMDSITVVTNSRFARLISRRLEERHDGRVPEVRVVDNGTRDNDERRGSIGDLRYAIEREGIRDDLLVTGSDRLFDFSLADMAGYFRTRGGAVNACFDTHDRERIRGKHGCALVDASGKITDFQEKPAEPRSSIESIALYLFPASVLPLVGEYLEAGNTDAPGFFLEWLHRRAPVYAWMFDGKCTDVGSLGAFTDANRGVAERNGLEVAVLVDHHASNDPAVLAEDLERALEYLEAGETPYLASLWTDAERVPLYERVLSGRYCRFPVAVKSRDAAADLEYPGILHEAVSRRSFFIARLHARPDFTNR